MKVFQIVNDICYCDVTRKHRTKAATVGKYPPDVVFAEAPDYVFEGWGFINGEFVKPTAPEGWIYDDATGTFYSPEMIADRAIKAKKSQLDSTDYKIIKCYEYQLAGLEPPYDINEIHAERQALRDEINALEISAEESEAN